ncbi:MAG: Ku protein [Theionarchaea archaeon]|nr:Ku protein [Theionarchaea archaeon]MBU6999672.1 Ku protein [Theionarchaea archaeon]MBU7022084.1 Ku protein [Theionarchaea archaeon]MBU7035943.1 Ku protein [Theionarchaea archaeon]MBU7040446.1 Ku protein [Theionarchaea archaeon]
MRSIWKGTIAFGLVNIPVALHTATRDYSVNFKNLCPVHHVPLQYKKWCPEGKEEIDYKDIEKGYQVGKNYVVIGQKELDALKLESTHTIDIEKFVDSSEIPILAYDSFYFLSPDRGGEKAYALLHEVLTLTGKVGIGKVVLHSKEYLVGLKNYQRGIILITLRYSDEIVNIDEALPNTLPETSEKEVDLARTLITKMEGDLDFSEYRDRYREEVEELVQKKLKGEAIVAEKVTETEKTKDILAALEKSIEARY